MAKRLAQHATALAERSDLLSALRESEPACSGERTDADLMSFLMACDMDVAKAAAKLRAAAATLKAYGIITMEHTAQFHRAPSPDRKLPDGVSMLLEDGKGGVARDVLGRPILACIGMQHGTAEEMRRTFLYAQQRAMQYALPGLPPGACCVVIDVLPAEKGAPPSFRFPDKDVRTVMELQERCFPGCLFSSTHFCGLPFFVTAAFRLVKPFMRRETYEAMVLKPSFAHLAHKHIAPEHMLERWGGSYAFDIDEYVERRADQEGIAQDQVCQRGHGRPFDAAAAAALQAAALAEATGGDNSSAEMIISAVEMIAVGNVRRQGVAKKRGSGRGLFATVRWKPKLLVLTPGGLAYFDETDPSDPTNKLSRLIHVDAASSASVSRLKAGELDSKGGPAQFTVTSGGRDYMFAVDASAEADAWVAAIAEVIRSAVGQPEARPEARPKAQPQAQPPSGGGVVAVAVIVEAPSVHAKVHEVVRLTPSQVEVVDVA